MQAPSAELAPAGNTPATRSGPVQCYGKHEPQGSRALRGWMLREDQAAPGGAAKASQV